MCQQATGEVLEVAIGTGLNLPHYPHDVQLTGIDFSASMLDIARQRASDLDMNVHLQQGDAQALDFPADTFDTVICTFGLCAIPDYKQAVTEMARVLKPGGMLLLADHVISTAWPIRAIQRLLETVTVPLQGEHFRRRPLDTLRAHRFDIETQQRFTRGIVERIAARKPSNEAALNQSTQPKQNRREP